MLYRSLLTVYRYKQYTDGRPTLVHVCIMYCIMYNIVLGNKTYRYMYVYCVTVGFPYILYRFPTVLLVYTTVKKPDNRYIKIFFKIGFIPLKTLSKSDTAVAEAVKCLMR